MKGFRIIFAVLVLSLAAAAQTEDHGQGAFSSEKGPIMLAVDASVAGRDLDSPYVLFVVFMAARDQKDNIVVGREGVSLIHDGREHKMPTLKDFRKSYGAEIRDIALYRHLGKEGIASSWIRFYRFPNEGDFYPPLTRRARIKTEQGSMSGFLGFMTKCYFKNPGFKKGDKIVIRVTARNKPEMTSEVAVVL